MFGLRTKLHKRFGLYPQIKDREGFVARFHHKTLPATRYGWGRKPANLFFERQLKERAPMVRPRLERYAKLAPFFAKIARDDDGTPAACWNNTRMPAIDAISICGMIEEFRPARFIEIGSGHSTRFACRAAEEFAPDCKITAIDPYPHVKLPTSLHRFIQEPLEATDLSIFAELEPNDIVFMDGSHHCFSNTDVTTFFLDVIPSLPAGVILCVHDIYLPWDYPPQWEKSYCNELQVVSAYLVGAGSSVEYLFPSFYINDIDKDLRAHLDPVWRLPALAPPLPTLHDAGAFWWRQAPKRV